MSVSSPVRQRHGTPSSTAMTRQPGSPTALDDEPLEQRVWQGLEPSPASLTIRCDDDQPQQSICQDLEPSPASPTGHSDKLDYVLMAAVCAIIVFLWMQ